RTWYQDFLKRVVANQDVTVDLQIGANLLIDAATRASSDDANKLRNAASRLTTRSVNEDLAELASRYADRTDASHYKELRVTVDPVRARFSTWYEMFPRSTGSFKDVEAVLP